MAFPTSGVHSPHPARSAGAPFGRFRLLLIASVLLAVASMAVSNPLSLAGASPSHTVAPPHTVGVPPASASVPYASVPGSSPPSSPSPALGSTPANSTPRPQWWDISSQSTTPMPVVENTQATWDAPDGGLLFYGGDNYAGDMNGTWMYATGQWTQVATHGNPGAITAGAMAYDPATGYSVFYGGTTASGFNNTTYYYSHGTWTAHQLAVSPPVQVGGQMVYDPALGGIVLFGGEDLSTTLLLNQTWLFDNGSWSKLSTPHAPTPRWFAQMTYDSGLGELVLYGGADASSNIFGDTWVFVNGAWSSVNAQGLGVPGIAEGDLVYDADLGTLLLVGGIDPTFQQQVGAWQFNGSIWSILPAQGGSHGHTAGIGAWDPLDHELILAGGGGGGNPSFTDVLSIPLAAANVTAPTETDIGVATNFSTSAVGGAPPYSYSWNWGDDSTNTTANATHAYRTAGAFVITLTVKGPAADSATWQREITVVAGPTPKLASGTRAFDATVPVLLTATTTGGVGPFRFSWTLSDGGSAVGPTLNHTFAQAGAYSLNLTTIDAVGGTGSALYLFTINATPTVGIAPLNSPEAGAATLFEAAVNGGTPPFSYAWQFEGGATAQGATPKHTFPSAGSETVSVNVTDADGISAQTTTTIDVVLGVAVSIQGPVSVTTGDTPTFTANVTQGVEPYNVTWTLPSGAVDNGTSTTYNFPGTGVFEITVKVVDANGIVAVSSLNVTVGSGSNGPLGGSVGGVPTWALVAAIVVIGAVAVGALAVARRRGPREPAAEAAPAGTPEP